MCIDEKLLSTYLDGELAEPFKSQTQEHLTYCSACSSILKKMEDIQNKVKTTLDEEVFTEHKDAVYSVLENKYFSTNSKKISFFKRKIEMGISSAITSAAAVVVIFVGIFSFVGNSSNNSEIMPTFNPAGSENVHFVSNEKVSLDSYSLEEILKYLDQKGYNIDISIKGITPIE